MTSSRICLLTSAHISYNPRLVKDADALAAAGYDVRVVATNLEPEKWKGDQALMTDRKWQLQVVTAYRFGSGHLRWLLAALRQRWCLRLAELFRRDGCVLRASSRYGPELARLAAREPADLFIAYKLQILPAAAKAARRWKARLGFDAEDFHRGMRRFDATPTREDKLVAWVEENFLGRCDHLTAASPGVADAISTWCDHRTPVPVLNVSRLVERPEKRLMNGTSSPLRLHWFSHMIGADRGLEDAVRAIRLLPSGSVELHLRGGCDADTRRFLDELIAETGVHERSIIVHAPVPPNELVRCASKFDVGLALETPISENRIICMNDLCTNKVFTYLMAGLALVASALKEGGVIYGGAGFSYPSGNAERLAAGLKRWLDDPAELQLAKARAWELATTRYNWEYEQKALLFAIQRALDKNRAATICH